MARFDVYEYAGTDVPLVLDVQADLLGELATRVVVPLVPQEVVARELLPKLKPVIEVQGRSYVLMTTDLGTLPRNALGRKIANIENAHRQTVVEALDFLFQGF